MSLNTLLSFIIAFLLVLGSIVTSTNEPMAFFNIPSILIVFGGTFAALFISYEFKNAMAAIRLMSASFKPHHDSETPLKDEVGRIVQWAYVIQKSGLQGLENEIDDALRNDEKFLSYGADLVVTGYTGMEVKQILSHLLQTQYEKDNINIEALKKMGGDAPAFGMLGTLIGLVIMLGSMGANPAAIGPSMAVALITTFYGIILARLVFIPLATKIASRCELSLFKHTLQMEGLTLLAERKSPRYIQDKINSFVEIKDQFSIDRDLTLSPAYLSSLSQPQTPPAPTNQE